MLDYLAAVITPGAFDEGTDGDRIRRLVAVILAPLLPSKAAGSGKYSVPLEEVGIGCVEVRMLLHKFSDSIFEGLILHILADGILKCFVEGITVGEGVTHLCNVARVELQRIVDSCPFCIVAFDGVYDSGHIVDIVNRLTV